MRTCLIIAAIAASLSASPAFSQCRSYTDRADDSEESTIWTIDGDVVLARDETGTVDLHCADGVCLGWIGDYEIRITVADEIPGKSVLINGKPMKPWCMEN